jgi:hypothetical protein
MWSMESYIDRRDLSKIISWYCRCTVINKYIIKITLQICILLSNWKLIFPTFSIFIQILYEISWWLLAAKPIRITAWWTWVSLFFTIVYNMIILVELARKLPNTIFIIDGYKCYKYVQNCTKKCEYVFPK